MSYIVTTVIVIRTFTVTVIVILLVIVIVIRICFHCRIHIKLFITSFD